MQTLSASEVKQRFGEILAAVAHKPVAIQRHGRTIALLVDSSHAAPGNWEQRLARADQAAVEHARLVKHFRIALELVSDRKRAAQLVAAARVEVERWRDKGLCSPDYIDRWSSLLRLDPKRLAVDMCGDLDGWGTAMRQNSPWVGLA
jgi:antitoxin (DNA-binding transcriptional repressor) of toxin-antitoxin stability system|nr:hypothetical protein [Panacagrimonas sp.]